MATVHTLIPEQLDDRRLEVLCIERLYLAIGQSGETLIADNLRAGYFATLPAVL